MLYRILSLYFLSLLFPDNCKLDSVSYIDKINKAMLEFSIQDSIKRDIKFESCNLITIGKNIYGSYVKLDSIAAEAFFEMKKKARQDSIELRVVSAFRSFEYQKNIIQNKIKRGKSIESILRENTLPGYSEHHTGYALDFTSKGEYSLSVNFEKTEEFNWLMNNANKYGFYLSYPRNNNTGIMYEPWHWTFKQ
tara:strand:+ start:336 stop:914 length:579 start_codon:yes stop_codon:yes gene_type:complete